MKKAKWIGVAVFTVLAIVIFLQNTEPVQARLLFLQVEMSRALLLMLTFVLGLATGILIARGLKRKSKA
ncbi:MAG: lipopolysaccharide assembly protein LapA domain-containing protein [Solirubrobacterales bacterium]